MERNERNRRGAASMSEIQIMGMWRNVKILWTRTATMHYCYDCQWIWPGFNIWKTCKKCGSENINVGKKGQENEMDVL